MQVYLGIDVGKTNLRVASFDGSMQMLERWSVTTEDVAAAVRQLKEWLFNRPAEQRLEGTGISTFGPLQTDASKPHYGAIMESSEPAWSGVNMPAIVAEVFDRNLFFDHDVNAGALAERMSGGGQGVSSFVYLSVGTGIGAAVYRRKAEPATPPQFGHSFIPREPDDLAFGGSCRFHGACLQGLASGRAIASRWGMPAEELPAGHPAWNLEARYLARACTNLIYSFSPEVIIFGSSVGTSQKLNTASVESHTRAMVNNFLEPELRTRYAERPIVRASTLGPDSSLLGAALMGYHRCGLPFNARERAQPEG